MAGKLSLNGLNLGDTGLARIAKHVLSVGSRKSILYITGDSFSSKGLEYVAIDQSILEPTFFFLNP